MKRTILPKKSIRRKPLVTWREAELLSKVFGTAPSNVIDIVRSRRKATKRITAEYYKQIREVAKRLRTARIENEEALSDHYADIIEEIKQK